LTTELIRVNPRILTSRVPGYRRGSLRRLEAA
jgi:hypothetical protein